MKCRQFEVIENQSATFTLSTTKTGIDQILGLIENIPGAVTLWNSMIDESYEIIDEQDFNGRLFRVTSSTIPNIKYISFNVIGAFPPEETSTTPTITFFGEDRRSLFLKEDAGVDLQLVNLGDIIDTSYLGIEQNNIFTGKSGTWINASSVSISFVLDFGDKIIASMPIIPTDEEDSRLNLMRPFGQLYVNSDGFVKMRLKGTINS